MIKGSVSISVGRNGGVYFRKGVATRLCLWRVAFTYYPFDLDDVFNVLERSQRRIKELES